MSEHPEDMGPDRVDPDGVDERELDAEALARGAWLVERALSAAQADAQVEPDEDREQAELRRFLADCRRALSEADDARDSAPLAERVLNATTREDLSVRGDFRLLRGWLADALRSSLLVRVAAASLLVHLFAVPVVAAILFFTNEPRTPARITFAPPLEDPFLPPDETSVELDLPPDDALFAELGADAPDPLAVANALRRARWSLTHGGAPAPAAVGAPSAAADPLERVLQRRAAALAARDWSAPLQDSDLQGVARVVWLETELDRFALTGALAPQWDTVLSSLESSAADPLSALERASLARAADYGLLDAGQRERWAEAVERARDETPRALPLDSSWLERLAACLPPGAAPGPELRAWLDWPAASESSR